MNNFNEKKISRVNNRQKCSNTACKRDAISFSNFCWDHTENKDEYRALIEKFASEGQDMSGMTFNYVNLSKLNLSGANFERSQFRNANL